MTRSIFILFSFISAGSETEMEIKSAKASDSGLWSCKKSQKTLDLFRLLVIPRFASGPFLFREDGNILSNSSVISGHEGQPLQLICVARQPADLQFDLNGHDIRSHKIQSYLMGPSEKTTVVYKMLNKTVVKSWKNISCGSTLVKINVQYSPSFTIKREPQFGIPILQGMTVMLACDVEANPPTNATGWLKNEKPLAKSQGSILILHNVDIKDVGWYQCTTKYYGETISSIGYFLNIHPAKIESLGDEGEEESMAKDGLPDSIQKGL